MLSESEKEVNSKEAKRAILKCKSINGAHNEQNMDMNRIFELEDMQEQYTILMDYKADGNNKKK